MAFPNPSICHCAAGPYKVRVLGKPVITKVNDKDDLDRKSYMSFIVYQRRLSLYVINN